MTKNQIKKLNEKIANHPYNGLEDLKNSFSVSDMHPSQKGRFIADIDFRFGRGNRAAAMVECSELREGEIR